MGILKKQWGKTGRIMPKLGSILGGLGIFLRKSPKIDPKKKALCCCTVLQIT